MNYFKKGIAIFIVAAVCLALLQGCDSNKTPSPEKTDGAQETAAVVSPEQSADGETAQNSKLLDGVSHFVQSTCLF